MPKLLLPLSTLLCWFSVGCLAPNPVPREHSTSASSTGYAVPERPSQVSPAGNQITDAASHIASELANLYPQGRKTRLLIKNFDDKANSKLGTSVRQAIRNALASESRFEIYDEEITQAVLKDLSDIEDRRGPLYETNTVKNLGTMKAPEAILQGTITDALNEFHIFCQIVPVSNLEVAGSSMARITKAVLVAPEAPRPSALRPFYLKTLHAGGGWPDTELIDVARVDSAFLQFTFAFRNQQSETIDVHFNSNREASYLTDQNGAVGEFANISGNANRGSLRVRPGTREQMVVLFRRPANNSKYVDLRIAFSTYGYGQKQFKVEGLPLDKLPDANHR